MGIAGKGDASEASKPTARSVTAIPCTCGVLEEMAAEAEVPVVFDERLNEYHLTRIGQRGYSMVYHCPFCGGAAPRSKRATLFATISREESDRLGELLAGITTLDEAVSRLGLPDHDLEQGRAVKTRATADKPEEMRSYRTLQYTKLSETVNVDIADFGPDGGVRWSLHGKYRG